MALKDILNAVSTSDVFSPNDANWVQFVSDHKEIIKLNSDTRLMSPEIAAMCSYSVQGYLRYIGIARDIGWIVLYINDMGSNIDFTSSRVLLVPPTAYVTTLYQQYQKASVNM